MDDRRILTDLVPVSEGAAHAIASQSLREADGIREMRARDVRTRGAPRGAIDERPKSRAQDGHSV